MAVSDSGTFQLGGDLPVHRLGFGAMRITARESGDRRPIMTMPSGCYAELSSSASRSSTRPTRTARTSRRT